MQPAAKGRYCESCEKNIVDLTSKSDAELVQFFQKKKDNVCGRLLSSQLNRNLAMPPIKASWQWLLPLAIGAIFIPPAQAAGSMSDTSPNNRLFSLVEGSQDSTGKKEVSLNKPELAKEKIAGKVIDSNTGAPLAGVQVTQTGFQNVLAVTDSAGRFQFSMTEENLSAAFLFNLVGYKLVEWKVTDGMVVKLSEGRRIVLGGISTYTVDQSPMYLIHAGKKSCTIDPLKFADIPQDWIEQIEILKDAQATALYGSRAVNGVILIKIKKAYAKKIDFTQNN